jgi:hypothetical protein
VHETEEVTQLVRQNGREVAWVIGTLAARFTPRVLARIEVDVGLDDVPRPIGILLVQHVGRRGGV